MIPKVIHWVWLGNNELTSLSERVIADWSSRCPDFEIKRWSEGELSVLFESPFFYNAMKSKKWAFAADYARLWILYNYGGVYLDTDMELVKDISPLLADDFFVGMEDDENISAGIIGAKPQFNVIKDILDYYDEDGVESGFVNIPLILTKYVRSEESVSIYPWRYFYPYNPYRPGSLDQLLFSDITEETFAIHHWEKKWKLGWIDRVRRKLAVSKLRSKKI